MRDAAHSSDDSSQSSGQPEDASRLSTPHSGITGSEQAPYCACGADPKEEPTCSKQTPVSAKPSVKTEPMVQHSPHLSAPQSDFTGPDASALPEKCDIPAEVSPASERTVTKPPPDQTRRKFHKVLGKDAMPKGCGCPLEGLSASLGPEAELPSDQAADNQPAASFGTTSAASQVLVDQADSARLDHAALIKRCNKIAKAGRSQKMMAKISQDRRRDNLQPVLATDAMPEGHGCRVKKLSASEGSVPKPVSKQPTASAALQLPVKQINSETPDTRAKCKRRAMETKGLRPSESIVAKPSQDRTQGSVHPVLDTDACGCRAKRLAASEGPVPKPPSLRKVGNQPPACRGTPSARCSMSPNALAQLKRCAMEAEALHPSVSIEAEPPSDQILDRLHPALCPAAMPKSCGCQTSEWSFEKPSDQSAPMEDPKEAESENSVQAYLYTFVWSSDKDSQSEDSGDSQAYAELRLPTMPALHFLPGSKLVKIGHSYWLAEPMASWAPFTYFLPPDRRIITSFGTEA